MDIPVIDLHADTYSKKLLNYQLPFLKKLYRKISHDKNQFKQINDSTMITPKNLIQGNVFIQAQSLFLNDIFTQNPLNNSLSIFSLIKQDCKKNKSLDILSNLSDYNLNESKTNVMITIEGLEIIENNLDLLDAFYDLGVRIIAPVWNRDLPYAGSVGSNFGIKEKGKELIKKMNEYNMILDSSHLSDKSFFDFNKLTICPLIASHSNARAINPSQRNLTDDQIKVIVEREGVIGLNFCPEFISSNISNHNPEYPEGFHFLYNMIDHIASKFSVDIISFGSDFDGILNTPAGLENPAFYPIFADFLISKRVSRNNIEKIFYKNALRVLNKCY